VTPKAYRVATPPMSNVGSFELPIVTRFQQPCHDFTSFSFSYFSCCLCLLV